jgi:ubiquinone/menaquinone biosynthesis C-methylase UbiE
MMRLWTDHILPRVTDKACASGELHRMRARACEGLRGHVLEVGFGSGLNVSHYPADVVRVDAVDPSDVAWDLSLKRLHETSAAVTRTGFDGERIAVDDETYDSVLSTFTMCTIPDLGAALAEIRRVLKPGGTLHFLEHGLSPDPGVAGWQRRLQPLHGRVAGGCHLDRPIDDHVARSGLDLDGLDTFYAVWPRPYGYIFLGRAGRA